MPENKEVRVPEKGFNLRVQECKEGIVEVINIAKLPPGVMLPILESLVSQVQMQNEAMIEAERRAWEKEGVKKDGN